MVDGKNKFHFCQIYNLFYYIAVVSYDAHFRYCSEEKSHGEGFETFFFVKRCRWSAMCVVPQSSRVLRRSSPKYSHSTHAYAFEGNLSISLQI